MNILISGGAKNGKSLFAQRAARAMAEEQKVPLYYVATMIPVDEEDEARIERHRRERAGWGFTTLERGRNLQGLLAEQEPDGATRAKGTETSPEPGDSDGSAGAGRPDGAAGSAGPGDGSGIPAAPDPRGVFLLDSVTALLGNEMFPPEGTPDLSAAERVAEDCVAFAERTGNTVFVSDYIFGGIEEYECSPPGKADSAGGGNDEEYDDLTEAYRRGLALIDRRLARVCDRVVEVSAGCVEDWKLPEGDGALLAEDGKLPAEDEKLPAEEKQER